ncbi:MAG: helix-turn-helix domain-containing protein [Desulfurobacteriaceae bacterium]
MLYVYRFRLYPLREQVEFLNRQIGHCRFVYNKLLEIAKEDYEREGKKWNYYEYKKLLPKLKQEFLFLKEANIQSLQKAVKWLDRAFNYSVISCCVLCICYQLLLKSLRRC